MPHPPAPAAPVRTRAIILAHFDRSGGFDPHVVQSLQRYRGAADRLIVVSSSARSLPRELHGVVDDFMPRANIGYDFCSWKAGLTLLRPAEFDEIVCVNDSVYGPFADPAAVFSDPRLGGADLWGMVFSEQATKSRGSRRCPHLQSWCFGMRRRLLASQAYAEFWSGVEPLASKEEIIDRYEIGMSEHFLRAGFRLAALYDARTEAGIRLGELWPHLSVADPRRSWRLWKKARRTPHNPSELVWWRLLDAGVPFVKVGLFRVNHYGLDLECVLHDLERRVPEAPPLIQGHLARCG